VTLYRDSTKPRRPIICGIHKDIMYVTNKQWKLAHSFVKEDKIPFSKKTIFFDTLKDMEQFLEDNCKVVLTRFQ